MVQQKLMYERLKLSWLLMRESLLLWFLSMDLFCNFLLYSSHKMPKVFQTLNCIDTKLHI